MTTKKISMQSREDSSPQEIFNSLGISCSEEVFRSLLPITIEDYKVNLQRSLAKLELGPSDRILVFRTANVHLVEALLTSLFHAYPSLEVDLVTQKAFLPHIKNKRVNPVLVSDGPMNQDILVSVLKNITAGRRYRSILVPYTNTHGHGYENVHHAVFSCVCGRLVGVGSDGRLLNIHRFERIKKACSIPLRAASFVFMLILLGGMALWFKGFMPATRLFRKSHNHL
jgi:hypothetical protein